LESTFFEFEVEIDETQILKKKKSKAVARNYKSMSKWLFGIKERYSGNFIIVPISSRSESEIIPLITRYVKIGTQIYSDEYSVCQFPFQGE
jgi:ISXO2-like transposase domain